MLVFIDESGHPIPTDNTERPVLLGVCIKETDIREINNYIHKAKIDVYGKSDVEIKATNLINRKILNDKYSNNKLFLDKIMNFISYLNFKVFAIIMERPDFKPFHEDGILPKQYYYMLKKIEFFCENYNYPMALIIFDEQDRNTDYKISIAFYNFLYQSKLGKTFKKILEVPLFTNSKITTGIQLADLMAGIVRHYYESGLNKHKPANDFESLLCKLFNIVKSKTENLIEKSTGFVEYGFFEMSKYKFQKSPEEED